MICDLSLGRIQEPLRDTAAPVLGGDIDLLDFIKYNHGESRDPIIDDGDRRVGNAISCPPLKGVQRPRRYQFLWDSAQVAIAPASAPDLGNTLDIFNGCGSEKNQACAHSRTYASPRSMARR
jgi:hypothetical protein